ncbi:MAG: low molecular weight protein arginine phosphatase [Sedimentibacter saalensis]|uniref:Protein-tyrosine phosphatase n=1 Tax=Sedimentibacter saalensis TaxID=130788 RepID=A0A562J465_9FIRM|nr:low molecular weight protein arginine phosphatase [Sedimentibacter saalensis]MEA5094889.1 low molecular weight protein arginine phosphatase [Sedimentibacter saalensis]TWH77950.1 protein-tyrosine phosphatase [Sedimentibacter saalensis]
MNILLVCTGNTCRSSMAEGIFKQMLIDSNVENINVSSAGLSAFQGDRANQKAIDVLKNQGIDISGHRARQLTGEMINSSDLILTMTDAHKMSILNYAPKSKGKVFTLKEYARITGGEESGNINLDIHDPYGREYSVYESVMSEIRYEIESIVNKLKQKNN